MSLGPSTMNKKWKKRKEKKTQLQVRHGKEKVARNTQEYKITKTRKTDVARLIYGDGYETRQVYWFHIFPFAVLVCFKTQCSFEGITYQSIPSINHSI